MRISNDYRGLVDGVEIDTDGGVSGGDGGNLGGVSTGGFEAFLSVAAGGELGVEGAFLHDFFGLEVALSKRPRDDVVTRGDEEFVGGVGLVELGVAVADTVLLISGANCRGEEGSVTRVVAEGRVAR